MRFQYRDRSNMVFPETWCSLQHRVRWPSAAHTRLHETTGNHAWGCAPRHDPAPPPGALEMGFNGGTPSRARGLVCMQENNQRQTGEVNNGSWTTEEEAIQATKCKD
jgi:hypothetical protein